MDAQVVSSLLPGKNSFFLHVSNLDERKEKFYNKTK